MFGPPLNLIIQVHVFFYALYFTFDDYSNVRLCRTIKDATTEAKYDLPKDAGYCSAISESSETVAQFRLTKKGTLHTHPIFHYIPTQNVI